VRLLLKGGENERVSLPVLRADSLCDPLHGLPGGRDPDLRNQSCIPPRAVPPLRACGRRTLLRSDRIEPDRGTRLAERGWGTKRCYPIRFQTRNASRGSNQEWLHPRPVTQQGQFVESAAQFIAQPRNGAGRDCGESRVGEGRAQAAPRTIARVFHCSQPAHKFRGRLYCMAITQREQIAVSRNQNIRFCGNERGQDGHIVRIARHFH
jgi:hypothetical protein